MFLRKSETTASRERVNRPNDRIKVSLSRRLRYPYPGAPILSSVESAMLLRKQREKSTCRFEPGWHWSSSYTPAIQLGTPLFLQPLTNSHVCDPMGTEHVQTLQVAALGG